MAIAQQLQAEGTAQNNAGQTVSVTLGAGSNRYMVVALSAEIASGTQAAPTSVTYGGNALALITDGSVTASQVSTLAGVFMYRLLEANMPANGANDLVVSWPATTTYVMGWWILTGVEQANADDVKILAQTTTATSITVTLDAGATTDAVICACYKNDTTGTVAITISGAGVTEDFDVSYGSARGAAGTDLPAVAAGTIACVATVSSTARRILVAIRLAEAPASIDITGAVTTSAPAVTGAVAQPGADPPEFVSIDDGGTPRDITISAGTDRLLVVAVPSSSSTPTDRVVTYDGVTLDVATAANDFVQIFYMLNPPVGTAQLTVSGINASSMIAVQYNNIASFQSAQQASVGSASYSPSGQALIVHCISASSVTHTPESGSTERIDAGGDWYGDRIVTSAGSVTVGVTDATDPDYAGAIFLGNVLSGGEDVTGAVSTSSAAVSGALETPKNVTGAVSTSSAAVAGALATPKNVSGAVTTSTAAVAGSLSTPKNVTGAVTTTTSAVAGSLSTPHNVSGAVTTATAAVAGAIDSGLTGAVTTSAPAVSGALETPKNVTGAVSTSGAAVSGALATPHAVSGAVTTSTATVAGSLQSAVNVTGAVSTSSAAVSGAVQTPKNVSGAVTTSTPEVMGSLATPHAVSGAVSTSTAVVTGSLATPHSISGAVSTSTAAVAGALATPHSISGAVTTSAPGLTGSISVVDEVDLNGAVSTSSAAVSGALATPHAVSGAVATSGAAVAGAVETPHNITGAVTTTTLAVAGSLQLLALLDGAVATSTPTVAGALTVVTGLSGAVSTSGAAVSGALNAVNAVDITGAVSTSTPEVAGSLTPAWDVTGAVSTSGATVSGAFVTPLGLDGDLQTSGAFITGGLELPLLVSGALTTSPLVASAVLFSIPPAGIPGTAVFEVAAPRAVFTLASAATVSSLAAATAIIESRSNGTTEV